MIKTPTLALLMPFRKGATIPLKGFILSDRCTARYALCYYLGWLSFPKKNRF
jgi:hypothetical protein